MSEQANVTLIMNLYDAFRRGNITTIMNHLDPQVEWEVEGPSTIPYAGVRQGREGAMKFFQGVATMDEITLTMEPFAAQGDNVVMAGRFKARVKSNGNRIDVPLVHLWTIRDGMIVRYQNMSDTAPIAAAFTSGAAAGR